MTSVFLVGAGPGDPALLTLKGKACLEKADVVIYDYLASPDLLKYAPSKAELIYAGKREGRHTLSQDEINALLIEKARAGLTVVRLKGGDPFIFGRGGEEAEVLAQAGIPFEVVPGVTAAVAAAAYAGIPLTHRDHTVAVTLVTGHEDPLKPESKMNWPALASIGGTLVFFMGVRNLPLICEKLMGNGLDPETPAAVVRRGTTSQQATVSGSLQTIADQVKAAGIKAPALIIIGEVVRLRSQLEWFEKRPLWGKRIVVTRARAQASDLVQRLSELGAECLEFPTIRVVPPADTGPLDAALDRLSEYNWLIFTSVNGVSRFFERLFEKGKDVRALGHLKIAAIGPATAGRLRELGLKSDIIPETYRAESVVAAFAGIDLKGAQILLPRAAKARPVLPQELSRLGAQVDEISVYETKTAAPEADQLLARLEAGEVDIITFTSSSTVENFKALIPADRLPHLLQGITIAAIGPITADTAKRLGFEVQITADVYTIDGLCAAILEHFQAR